MHVVLLIFYKQMQKLYENDTFTIFKCKFHFLIRIRKISHCMFRKLLMILHCRHAWILEGKYLIINKHMLLNNEVTYQSNSNYDDKEKQFTISFLYICVKILHTCIYNVSYDINTQYISQKPALVESFGDSLIFMFMV